MSESKSDKPVFYEELSSDVSRQLSILATPKNHVTKEKGKPIEEFFFAVLRYLNPEKYGSLNIMNADSRWAYVDACVDVLTSVADQMYAYGQKIDAAKIVEQVPDLLNTTEITHVVTLIEIIIAWGITPSLSEGLRVPLDLRLKNVKFDMSTIRVGSSFELARCAGILYRFCHEPLFFGFMQSKYCMDVLASLLQIAYGPRVNVAGPEIPREWVTRAQQSIQWISQNFAVDFLFNTYMAFMRPSAPNWIKAPVGALLTRWILRDGAVFILINGMIVNSGEDSRDDAIGRAVKRIAVVPKRFTPETYYAAVCPQVVKIVQQITAKADDAHVYCGLLIIRTMSDFAPDLAQKYFVQPTIDAFKSYNLTEKELEVYVVYINRLVSHEETAESFAPAFDPIFPMLLDLLLRVNNSVSSLKQVAKECVSSVFVHAGDHIHFVKSLLSRQPESISYEYTLGPSGGIILRKKEASPSSGQQASKALTDASLMTDEPCPLESQPFADDDAQAELILDLLKLVKMEDVAGTIFLDLLKLLYDSTENSDEGDMMKSSSYANRTLCMSLLSLFPSVFGPDQLMRNIVQLTSFISVMLNSSNAVNINMAVLLLRALLSGDVSISPEHAFLFHRMLPALEQIVATPPDSADPQLVSMTRSVIDLITAEDPVWTDKKNKNGGDGASVVLQPESSKVPSRPEDIHMSPILFKLSQELKSTSFAERGGALISLRKMILERNKAVSDSVPDVIGMFSQIIECPEEEDFVCGTAIDGLACLGDLYPTIVIPKLLELYGDIKLVDNVRARVGEALLQTLRLQGEMIVSYLESSMAVLLRNVTSVNPPIVRASALSIIGSLIRNNPIAYFYNCLQELLFALNSVMTTDDDAFVRRGCTLVFLALSLSMLSTQDALTTHLNHLTQIREFLQIAAHTDSDDIVRANAITTCDTITDEVPLITEQK